MPATRDRELLKGRRNGYWLQVLSRVRCQQPRHDCGRVWIISSSRPVPRPLPRTIRAGGGTAPISAPVIFARSRAAVDKASLLLA